MVGVSHFTWWHMKSTIKTKWAYSCLPAFTCIHNFTGQSKLLFQTDYLKYFYSILLFCYNIFWGLLSICFSIFQFQILITFQLLSCGAAHLNTLSLVSILRFNLLKMHGKELVLMWHCRACKSITLSFWKFCCGLMF